MEADATTLPAPHDRIDPRAATAPNADDVRGLRRRRLFAWAVDGAICLVLTGVAGLVVWPVSWLFPPIVLLLALVPLAYNAVLISGPRRGTWGQRLAGVELSARDGTRASLAQAAAHFAIFYVTVAFTWGLILVWSFFNPRKRLLHDVLTGMVARRRAAPEGTAA